MRDPYCSFPKKQASVSEATLLLAQSLFEGMSKRHPMPTVELSEQGWEYNRSQAIPSSQNLLESRDYALPNILSSA